LSRKDLIEALAKDLPAGAIRFGCRIAAVDGDPGGHGAVLTMADGTTMKAKVVRQLSDFIPNPKIRFIFVLELQTYNYNQVPPSVLTLSETLLSKMQVLVGCDGGTNSVVAKYLGLPPVRSIPRPVFRGFTSYPHGHPFGNEFLRLRVGDFFIGRLPVTDNLVHFFLTKAKPAADEGLAGGDLRRVRDLVLKDLEDLRCPAEITELVRRSDPESLNLVTNFWYRPPWEVALRGFRRGTVTVAGDAMHAMGPFIGQGGSAGLEDAVVLARSLARAAGDDVNDKPPRKEAAVGEALGGYVRERRLRLTLLSLESFIMGVLLVRSPSPAVKLACVAVLILLGSKSLRNANFDCGRL
jgi:2-polyprenyl-6-methoxyphenol hydroxylase-like FAD-dependent oxidoreductase